MCGKYQNIIGIYISTSTEDIRKYRMAYGKCGTYWEILEFHKNIYKKFLIIANLEENIWKSLNFIRKSKNVIGTYKNC